MKETILIIGIIFLLIGVSIASSTTNRVKHNPGNTHITESLEASRELLSRNKIAFAFCAYDPSGQLQEGTVYFYLDDPGNITPLCHSSSGDFLVGGTWTNDWRWLTCNYGTGSLCEVNPGGGWTHIGGGGTSLIGLAYYPDTKKLYGASYKALYEINIKNGNQIFISNFSSGPSFMISIAFDKNGTLYGWDTGTDNLWIIDTETAECYLIGPLGIDINYVQDGAFDYDTDNFYLSAYTNTMKSQLYTCDKYTGQCTLVGDFQGDAELSAFTIPYLWWGPTPDFYWTPNWPDPDEPIIFDASYSYIPEGNITLYEWDWDNDGVFDEIKTSPTTTYSWSERGYYPVSLKVTDNAGLNLTKTKKVILDQPPNPPQIKGPKYVKKGVSCNYSVKGTDPDGDDLEEFFMWFGDNGGIGYGGPFPSGTTKYFHHTWHNNGTFILRAKVRDVYDVSSDWSYFVVNVSTDKTINSSLFLRFLERYPLLSRLLNLEK